MCPLVVTRQVCSGSKAKGCPGVSSGNKGTHVHQPSPFDGNNHIFSALSRVACKYPRQALSPSSIQISTSELFLKWNAGTGAICS